jgi:hypothetical protein
VARSGEASRKERRRWAGSGVTRGAALEQKRTSGGVARRPAAALPRGRGGGQRKKNGGGCGRTNLNYTGSST